MWTTYTLRALGLLACFCGVLVAQTLDFCVISCGSSFVVFIPFCIICTFLVWTFLDFLVLFSIPSLCLYNTQDLVCICLGYFVSTFYRLPNIMFYLSWYINGMFLFLNVLLTTRRLTSTLISWYINNHWLFFHYVSHF